MAQQVRNIHEHPNYQPKAKERKRPEIRKLISREDGVIVDLVVPEKGVKSRTLPRQEDGRTLQYLSFGKKVEKDGKGDGFFNFHIHTGDKGIVGTTIRAILEYERKENPDGRLFDQITVIPLEAGDKRPPTHLLRQVRLSEQMRELGPPQGCEGVFIFDAPRPIRVRSYFNPIPSHEQRSEQRSQSGKKGKEPNRPKGPNPNRSEDWNHKNIHMHPKMRARARAGWQFDKIENGQVRIKKPHKGGRPGFARDHFTI